MVHQLDVELSAELEKFRDKIAATIKPFIAIQAIKEQKLTVWQSKFGGLPYLPQNSAYPQDSQGNPLFLLAQINFQEVPYLEGFPQTGILQFYLADDGRYGANFDNPTQQTHFRIIYFSDIVANEAELITDLSFLPKPKRFPLTASCALQFKKTDQPVSMTDYQFDELVGNEFFAQFGDQAEKIKEEYLEKFSAQGHKMGGYAYFTQEDPRLQSQAKGKYNLLLQIDTDDATDIMWGDSGVGNFFIPETNLSKRDFSQVLYNWDCH